MHSDGEKGITIQIGLRNHWATKKKQSNYHIIRQSVKIDTLKLNICFTSTELPMIMSTNSS